MTTQAPGRMPSRNEPCPCGSGRKYKLCCLAAGRHGQAAELHTLGVAALAGRRFDSAVDLISQAIELETNAKEYYRDLAVALEHATSLTSASASRLRRIWPRDAQVQQLAAEVLFRSGDLSGALDACRAALRIDPENGESKCTLAFILGELGDNEAAVDAYRAALRTIPDDPALYHNLGDCLRQLGRLDEAHDALRQAVSLAPRNAKSQLNLAHLQQMLCDWQGLEDRWLAIRMAVTGAGALNPFFFLSVPATPVEQLTCARTWVADRFGVARTPDHHDPVKRKRGSAERLHIGYLSSDLREHAVARLIAEVFELHDRSGFVISAYSIGPDDGSALRRRLTDGVDRFIDLSRASRAQAARCIAGDGVDILVDLNGHTARNRADILVLRPAPIQVSYWGFPGTTGAPFIDYAIVDPFVVPPEQRGNFSERLAYMPHCYMPNDRKRPIAGHLPSRAECGLPESSFVFCAFNHLMKLSPAMFDVWMRVLAAVPDSVLWLLETNRWAAPNLRHEASRAGLDPDRLVFAPPLPLPDHLARHRSADLFLDTLPYNGHTTTNDALWAGLPVLTCTGDTFASRVAGSALHAAGLPELVTDSLGAYETLAIDLARNPDRLLDLRSRLARSHEAAPLFDCTAYTANLETLYRRMWDEQSQSSDLPPDDRPPLST